MKKQSLWAGSLILIISAVAAKFFSACFKIPLTNLIGGIGISFFSNTYSLFLPVYAIATSGISCAVSKTAAENASKENWLDLRRLYRYANILFIILGSILSAVFLFCSKKLCSFPEISEECLISMYIIAPSILLGCYLTVLRSFYEGLQNMIPTAISQIIEAASKMLFGLAMSFICYSCYEKFYFIFPLGTSRYAIAAAGGTAGVTISIFVSCIYMMIYHKISYKSIPETNKTDTHRSDIIKSLIRLFIPAAATALLNNITTIIDLVTIQKLMKKVIIENENLFSPFLSTGFDTETLPMFFFGAFSGLSVTIFNLVPSVTNMFGKSVLPCVTDAWQSGRKKCLEKYLRTIVFSVGIISIPCVFGIFFMSGEILSSIFPHKTLEIQAAAESLSAMAPGILFLSFTFPFFSIFQAVGKQNVPIILMIIGGFAKLAGNIILISVPEINIAGAGAATSISYFIIFIISAAMIKKELGISLKFLNCLIPISYCGLLCGMSCRFFYMVCIKFAGSTISLAVSILLAAALFFISLSATGQLRILKEYMKH